MVGLGADRMNCVFGIGVRVGVLGQATSRDRGNPFRAAEHREPISNLCRPQPPRAVAARGREPLSRSYQTRETARLTEPCRGFRGKVLRLAPPNGGDRTSRGLRRRIRRG